MFFIITAYCLAEVELFQLSCVVKSVSPQALNRTDEKKLTYCDTITVTIKLTLVNSNNAVYEKTLVRLNFSGMLELSLMSSTEDKNK